MKVLVVGGVAAGMSTAARLRRMDEAAEIVVLERGKHVSFANCGLPYHIGGSIRDREALLLHTPQTLKASLNLDVRVEQEAVNIDRTAKTVQVRDLKAGRDYTETYDKLVLCPGALPVRPPLPGMDSSRVSVLRNIEDMDRIKSLLEQKAERAVVIGGGYIGVEVAENLHARGLQVDVVEMADQIIPLMDREMTRDLESHIRMKGVRLQLGASAKAFREHAGRVDVELSTGVMLPADAVILSVGVRPDIALARSAGLEIGPRSGIKVNDRLQTSDPDIYAAGDAVEVVDAVTGILASIPLAGPANRQGRIVAENICGRNSTCVSTKGTAIVKVFDMTAACVGASEKTLAKAGIPYRKVYTHPSSHAGYYPGATQMHLKVLFAPDTGKLLGAQAVGFDGVDKRIDVLATALYAGLTVFDLQNLELAYAPPYGSAKDPVNMAGFVAGNLLRGDVEFWYAEEFPSATDAGTILDVRSPDEFESWHISGAVNIPLSRLRKSLDRLDRAKPLFVYCKVGFRSYLAYRILKQNGFRQVKTLAGGTLTFNSFHGSNVCAIEEDEPPLPKGPANPGLPAASALEPAVQLDLRGLQCPGPIRKLSDALPAVSVGQEIVVLATDLGFATDVSAWCDRRGCKLLAVEQQSGVVRARLLKVVEASQSPASTQASRSKDAKTIVVFSGDLDKVMAAFVIANGAVSMGNDVSMFFTFWGLNALRKPGPQAAGKGVLDFMFGWMMPKGLSALKLSQMHMLGAGTAMMKWVMRSKNVDSLQVLVDNARKAGVRLIACTMSMDVMGIRREELMDGIELGGVAAFLGEADKSNATLFI